MRYKLIAADMDGTLLNNKGLITEKTRDAILHAVKKGAIFTICTGRPIQGIRHYRDFLGLTGGPAITYNGAMVITGVNEDVLFRQGLSSEDAARILDWAKRLGTTYVIWSDNKLYASELNERVYNYKKLSTVEPVLIEDEESIIRQGVTKILWNDDTDKIESYRKILEGKFGSTVSFYTSQPIFLEFVDSRVSKAIAMEKLGEHLGICPEEMIAIGDGFNDLSMIEYAGMGIAMENAPEEVKLKADFVTLSNEEDGVAHALMRFFPL